MNLEQETPTATLCVPKRQQNTLSKSADLTTSVQSLSKIDSDNEDRLNELKEKAHKSFLQVIQMEHLHQQEIQMLREEYDSREEQARSHQEQLLVRIVSLESEIKCNNRHNLQLSNSSFSLDGIDAIPCKESETSRIDESSIMKQFREIITQRDMTKEDKLRNFQLQIGREINRILKPQSGQDKKLDQLFDRIFKVILDISDEAIAANESYDELLRSHNSLETQYKSLKIQYQSSQKEAKFLSEHIKRISGDKFALQKKVTDLTKIKRVLEESVKHLKGIMCQNGIQSKVHLLPEMDNKSCVNMDLSINSVVSDFNLDDLNFSRDSVRTMKTDLLGKPAGTQLPFRITLENKGGNPVSSIKNFRKKKQLGRTQNLQKFSVDK